MNPIADVIQKVEMLLEKKYWTPKIMCSRAVKANMDRKLRKA
jgi:hypothetical protein